MKQAFSFPKSSEKRPGFRSGCKAAIFSGVANRTKPNKKSMEPDSVKNPGEGPGAGGRGPGAGGRPPPPPPRSHLIFRLGPKNIFLETPCTRLLKIEQAENLLFLQIKSGRILDILWAF